MTWGYVAGAAISVVGGALLSDDNGAEGMNDASADASRIQAQIGQEQWDRYRTIYGPLEDEFINESRGIGSIANQNRSAQQASADVAGSFANVRERLNSTPGANPSSQAYLQEQNRINLAEAASSAAAQSGAREATQTRGRAALTDVVSLGRNLPANATSALGSAASGLASAGRYAQNRSDATSSGFGRVVGGITGSSGFRNWVNGSSSPVPAEAAPSAGYGPNAPTVEADWQP